jgi:hypothetical protein
MGARDPPPLVFNEQLCRRLDAAERQAAEQKMPRPLADLNQLIAAQIAPRPAPTLGDFHRSTTWAGYDASAAGIMRPSLVLLPSSCGGQTPRATNYAPARAAAARVQHFSIRDGRAIILAPRHSRSNLPHRRGDNYWPPN